MNSGHFQRHIGHVLWVPSHGAMHASWNSWVQGICFNTSPTAKLSRQTEHCDLGSPSPKLERASTSDSVMWTTGRFWMNETCVGFPFDGAASNEAVREVSNWSSKLYPRSTSCSAVTQFCSPALRKIWIKLLLQRVHSGGRTLPIWKKRPHSKQNAWSVTLPFSWAGTTHSPAMSRRDEGPLIRGPGLSASAPGCARCRCACCGDPACAFWRPSGAAGCASAGPPRRDEAWLSLPRGRAARSVGSTASGL
mmetsp:Transcript_73228/g.210330  ORF Transcript_73228/g.210330 Transcript_73228/m.210330 type:complete len:250 (-) Transcript_73228:95-844(-)